jgi:2-polyprenyl-3-methyl-5-hydroxy-6-metoxy-1,4-benzoquinol methylase
VRDDELTAALQEVRDRARARAPQGSLGLDGVEAADLMPLLHARDAAEAKVAAIGTVNPRPPGFKNAIAQKVKHLVSRALDWHVREQVEFNRASMACVQATLEAMNGLSRSIAALSGHHQRLRQEWEASRTEFEPRMAQFDRQLASQQQESEELRDIRRHWQEWRTGFEERRNASEIYLLRSLSELQGAFQHRVTLLDESFRTLVQKQHGEFRSALEANTVQVQERLWKDLERIQSQYEALIQSELRALRQRPPVVVNAAMPAVQNDVAQMAIPIDWTRFANVFRGPEERIRGQQDRYVQRFLGTSGEILDIGCGRGEFLLAAREAGLKARGIDLSPEAAAESLAKGLNVEVADMFDYLAALPDRFLDGVYCSQVIEHLPPHRLPALVQLLGKKVRAGALVAFETPNPECLAIFATHFYIDPTHTRPVPPVLMHFYLEEAGFGRIEVERLAPAVESIPALGELPEGVRESLFGGLDYSIFARKL